MAAGAARLPALAGPAERLHARAALDAVVAHAWGFPRDGYAVVLEVGRAPSALAACCLAAYDDLADGGLEAFARTQDPLDGIPLVTSLPSPAKSCNLTESPEYR